MGDNDQLGTVTVETIDKKIGGNVVIKITPPPEPPPPPPTSK